MSGDVLFSGGYIVSALQCYQSALAAISTANPGPCARDPPDGSHAHTAPETWARLSFWLLKKSLLCLALASGANPLPGSSPCLDAQQTLHAVLCDQMKAINDSYRASRDGSFKNSNKSSDSVVCDNDDDVDDVDVTWAIQGIALAATTDDSDDDDSMMMSFSATEGDDDCFELEGAMHPGSASRGRGIAGIDNMSTTTVPSSSSSGVLANGAVPAASPLQLSCRFVRVLADHDRDHDHTQSRHDRCGDEEKVEESMAAKAHTISASSKDASCFRVFVQAELLHVGSTPTSTSDGTIPRVGGRIHDNQGTRASKKRYDDEHDCDGEDEEESIVVISCDAACHVMRNGDEDAAVVSSIEVSGSNSSGGSSIRGGSDCLAVGERLFRAFQFSVKIPSTTKDGPFSSSGSRFSSSDSSSSNQDKLKAERIEKALERIEKALERDEMAAKQSENSTVKSPVKRNLLDGGVSREDVAPMLLVDLAVRYHMYSYQHTLSRTHPIDLIISLITSLICLFPLGTVPTVPIRDKDKGKEKDKQHFASRVLLWCQQRIRQGRI